MLIGRNYLAEHESDDSTGGEEPAEKVDAVDVPGLPMGATSLEDLAEKAVAAHNSSVGVDGDDKNSSGNADIPSEKSGDAGVKTDEDVQFEPDLVARAETYGVSADDLKEFGSPEELDRFLRITERQFLAQGVKAREADKPGESSSEQTAKAPDAGKESPPPKESDDALDWGEDESVFDPAVVKNVGLVAKQNRQLAEQLQKQTEEFQELQKFVKDFRDAEQQQASDRFNADFHGTIEQLGFAELFGEPGKITQQQDDNRGKVFQTLQDLMQGMIGRGLAPQINKSLIESAVRAAHPAEVDKITQRRQADRIRKQSQRRLGPGGSSTTRQNLNAGDYNGPPEEDPELRKAWESFREQNASG